MGSKESNILKRVQVAMTDLGARVFRNNVGVARYEGAVVKYGLCKGSSDLIGWVPLEITSAHVGKRLAVFVAIEVKTPTGRVSKDQANFLAHVAEAGGIAIVARRPEDVDEAIREIG